MNTEVTQTSGLTHSYTLQPKVCANGTLLSPVFVVLQELNGIFGPRVRETMFRSNEIEVHCSSSGLVEKRLLVDYFKLFAKYPNTNGGVLIHDSYTGYADREYFRNYLPNDFNFTFEVIPPGCTPFVQPLDNPLNRTIKSFIRLITKRLNSQDPAYRNPPNFPFHSRDNRLKIISLTFNQLRSPRFRSYILYAWYKCQYITGMRQRYISPIQYCFTDNMELECGICAGDGTVTLKFMRCSWCEQYFCSFHIFHDQLHLCTQLH